MTDLPLIKMHGCGNDYLFVDCFRHPVPADPAALARRLSDRHAGVGADGLVLMCPSASGDADADMTMYNADGSAGELCGNALRCFAMWLHQSGRTPATMRIRMPSRIVTATVISSDADAGSAIVELNLGPPSGKPSRGAERTGEESRPDGEGIGRRGRGVSASLPVTRMVIPEFASLSTDGHIHCVSLGNPHAVLFVSRLSRADFLKSGPQLERHAAFPERTNVEFADVIDPQTVRVDVWERGSGETRACGSGACAVLLAGIARGVLARHQPVGVRMRGGLLHVTLTADGDLQLSGPAQVAFRCTVPLP